MTMRVAVVPAVFFLLAACNMNPMLGLLGKMDNPVDPQGEAYQGYEIEEKVDEVDPALPEDGKALKWIFLRADGCAAADRFHLQISSSVADITAGRNLIVNKDDFTTSGMIVPESASISGAGKYFWRIRAREAGSGRWGRWSGARSFSCIPAITVDAAVLPAKGGTIPLALPLLDWGDIEGAAGYRLQYGPGILALDTATPIAITASAYQIPPGASFSHGSNVYWRIRPVNKEGVCGSWCGPWSFTVDMSAVVPLSPPDDSMTNDTTPSFAWQSNALAVSYRFQLDDESTFGSPLVDRAGLTTTDYTLTGVGSEVLSNGSTYYWRVALVDGTGTPGSWSSTGSLKVNIETVSLVSPSNTEVVGTAMPTFRWDSSPTAAKYILQIDDAPNFTSPVIDIREIGTAERTLTGVGSEVLSNGSTYYWRVAFVGGNGTQGAWSTVWSFRIDISTVSLSFPGALASMNDTTPSFAWQSNALAVSYRFQLDDESTFGSPLVDRAGLTTTDYTLTGVGSEVLSNGSTYYWRVALVDGTGTPGSWSSTRSLTIRIDTGVTIVPQMDEPISVTLTGGLTTLYRSGSMTVSATVPVAVDSYQWYLDGSPITGATAASVTIAGSTLVPGSYKLTVVVGRGTAASGAGLRFTVSVYNYPAPQLVSPATGTYVSTTAPLLDWSDVEGASGYEVQLAASEAGVAGTAAVAAAGSSYQVSTPLSGTTWYWRVRAKGSGGSTSDWSPVWSFTTMILYDFESGSLPSGWSGTWTVSGGASGGSYCLRSGSIGHGGSSSVSMTLTLSAACTIRFSRQVSSEGSCDFLRFYIDNTLQSGAAWSGSVGWAEYSTSVSAGTHTFRWTYSKDGSVVNGSDCAWIDDVRFSL